MSSLEPLTLPDPERRGGPAWMERTGGRLSLCDGLRGAGIAAVQQVQNLSERLMPRLARSPGWTTLPPVPDSRVVRLAEEAAMAQPETLRLHGFRTAAFGRALAYGDGVPVDPELLFVCGLLHDVGLVHAVTGEDFTIRSAAAARGVTDAAGLPTLAREQVADGILVHTTIGVTAERDGALGAYTQFGAMVDLTGLRLTALPDAFVRSVLDRYPRGPFKRHILTCIEAEARAVPRGRFALAKGVGFGLAVRMAPFAT